MVKNSDQQLNDIGKQVDKATSGEYSVKSLLTNDFIQQHSKFESFDELLEQGGFKHHTQEEFNAIDQNEFDEYLRRNTDFNSWQEMGNAAFNIYARKNLGFK